MYRRKVRVDLRGTDGFDTDRKVTPRLKEEVSMQEQYTYSLRQFHNPYNPPHPVLTPSVLVR